MSSRIISMPDSNVVSRFHIASVKLGEFWMMLGSNAPEIVKIATSRLDEVAAGRCKVILG
jgi:hypothetical protein